jgi:hypothetical protein
MKVASEAEIWLSQPYAVSYVVSLEEEKAMIYSIEYARLDANWQRLIH